MNQEQRNGSVDRNSWANASAKLWWSTWPALVAAGIAYAVWVNQSINTLDRRVVSLERGGPKDDEVLRLTVLAEVQTKQAELEARTSAKLVEIMTKLDGLHRSMLEIKIRDELLTGPRKP